MAWGVFSISVFVFFFIAIIVHELGHLFFGLLTGYKFSLLSLCSFAWYKESGKMRFVVAKRFLLGGQCLMAPPEKEEGFSYVLYNLGGGLFNLIFVLILSVMCMMMYANDTLALALLAGILVNLLCGIFNLWPMTIDYPNDGMNVLRASQSKDAKHGLYLVTHLHHMTIKGKRYRDFGYLRDVLFRMENKECPDNYLAVQILLLHAEMLNDMRQYDEAVQVLEGVCVDALPPWYRFSVEMIRLYYYCVYHPDYEKAQSIYNTEEFTKFYRMDIMTTNRALAAYEYFVAHSKDKAIIYLEKAKKSIAAYPAKGYRIMEDEKISDLEELIRNHAPDSDQECVPIQSTEVKRYE